MGISPDNEEVTICQVDLTRFYKVVFRQKGEAIIPAFASPLAAIIPAKVGKRFLLPPSKERLY
jgi:hypothetical protein